MKLITKFKSNFKRNINAVIYLDSRLLNSTYFLWTCFIEDLGTGLGAMIDIDLAISLWYGGSAVDKSCTLGPAEWLDESLNIGLDTLSFI